MALWIDKYAVPMEAGYLGSNLDPHTLKSYEKTQWILLARLLNVPWFRRVWTVQELGLSTEAVFLYGSAEAAFISLLKVSAWLEGSGQLIRLPFRIGHEPRHGYGFCVLFYKQFDPDLITAMGCRVLRSLRKNSRAGTKNLWYWYV
jgi:hypothetical protein